MATSPLHHNRDNVVDLFTRKPWSEQLNRRLIRLAPELDGLEMVYSNPAHPNRLFAIKILCWGLRADGEVVGLVPWLHDLVACEEIDDAITGRWEGYYDPGVDDIFFEAPLHKVIELESAAEYYDYECDSAADILQEVPDSIGTHAVLSHDGFKTLLLKEVVSWRLYCDGSTVGMLADETRITATPVLPGDECLYPASDDPDFRYYFQHHIANKIKAQDPDALAAISMLTEL